MQHEKWLGSIWFWWALTTLIYSLLITNVASGGTAFRLISVLGIFVPFGPASFWLLFIPLLAMLSIPAWVFGMIYGQKNLDQSGYSLGKKISVILVMLFFITIVVDLTRFTPFRSILMVVQGHYLEIRM